MGWERHRLGGLIDNNLGGLFFYSTKPEVRFCTSCVLYAQGESTGSHGLGYSTTTHLGQRDQGGRSVRGAKAWFYFVTCVARSWGDPW